MFSSSGVLGRHFSHLRSISQGGSADIPVARQSRSESHHMDVYTYLTHKKYLLYVGVSADLKLLVLHDTISSRERNTYLFICIEYTTE